MKRQTLLDAAIWYARQDWPVFPCVVGDKKPAITGNLIKATCHEGQIEKWWSRRAYNIGLPTGIAFVVLDADNDQAIEQIRKFGTTEDPTVRSARGVQWYFRTPTEFEVRNSAGHLAGQKYKGIDVRGKGGYVVAPPSVHPSGPIYRFIREPFALLDFPKWLEEFVRPKYAPPAGVVCVPPDVAPGEISPYGRKVLSSHCSDVAGCTEGGRHYLLAKASFCVGQLVGSGHIPQALAESELLHAAKVCGLEKKSALRCVAQCMKAGKAKPYFPPPRT